MLAVENENNGYLFIPSELVGQLQIHAFSLKLHYFQTQMISDYCYLLIILLALTLTEQASPSPDQSLLIAVKNIQEDSQTGMQQILSFCSSKKLSRLQIDGHLNNYGLKSDGRATKNGLIAAINQLKKSRSDKNRIFFAKEAQDNKTSTMYIQTALAALWSWFQENNESLQFYYWLTSFLFFDRIFLRERHLQIVVKLARAIWLQNVIIFIYVQFFSTESKPFRKPFFLLFIEHLCLQLFRYYLDKLQIRRQIVTKVTLSNQRGKKPLLESISAKDLNRQINDVCSICCTSYSYEDIVQYSSEKKKKSADHFVVKTACGHYFHFFCLNQWMASGKSNCPFDKTPIHEFDLK